MFKKGTYIVFFKNVRTTKCLKCTYNKVSANVRPQNNFKKCTYNKVSEIVRTIKRLKQVRTKNKFKNVRTFCSKP